MTNIKRSDWVTVDGFSQYGIVTSVSRDKTTAVVEWPTGKKRMPVSKLTVQSTINIGGGWSATDVTREQELREALQQEGSDEQ